jgi:RNA polymerase sigma-70 factor, ECF subfamily
MNERDLVLQAQEGSREAFALVIEKYQRKVFQMVYSFTGNRETADDLSQDVFVKAWLALPRFGFRSEFGTWLYRIAVNHAKDFLRKNKKIREVPLQDVGDATLAVDGNIEAGERDQEARAVRDFVRRGLAALPEKHRVILTLRDIQGLTYEDIAGVLGISPGTVDSRIHRARRRLRTILEPGLESEGGVHAL